MRPHIKPMATYERPSQDSYCYTLPNPTSPRGRASLRVGSAPFWHIYRRRQCALTERVSRLVRVKAARAANDADGGETLLIGRSENFISSCSDLKDSIVSLVNYSDAASALFCLVRSAAFLSVEAQGSAMFDSSNVCFEVLKLGSRVRHQNADFAFLVKPLPCESTTYAHFCGSFVVATA